MPDGLSIGETISYIASLPNYDNPELFGMHQNAEKTYNEHTSKELVNYLHYFQPSYQLDQGYKMDFIIKQQKKKMTSFSSVVQRFKKQVYLMS